MLSNDPKLVADILVNLFGAGGVLLVAHNMRHYGPSAPVVFRMRWALRLCALLFVVRSLAWASDSGLVNGLANFFAAAMPVAALVVSEGLMRRHAPRGIKITVLALSLLAVFVHMLPGLPAVAGGLSLMAAVVGGFSAIAYFLVTRSRHTLSDAENMTINRVIAAMVVLLPLIATDFRSLWPDIHVRLGALGVLIMVFVAFGPGSSSERGWERALALVMFTAIAGIFAYGYVATGQSTEPGQLFRAAVVGVAGLIFAALFSELLGARAERRKGADPLLQAKTAKQFVTRLEQHDLIGDTRILNESDLASLHHPSFNALLAVEPVLRLAEAPWGRSETDDGVERARSLLSSNEATHAMLLSTAPMRMAVFSLPQAATNARVESELNAAQRIGELVFSNETET